MIDTEVARDRQHRPFFWSRRISSRRSIELTHLYGDETILQDAVALLWHVAAILSDVVSHILHHTFDDVGHGNGASVDRLESRTVDITSAVIAAGCSIFRAIHVMPEATQNVVDDKLTRFAIVQVEHELAGMICFVVVDDLLNTAFTGRVPASASQYLDTVVFERWYREFL